MSGYSSLTASAITCAASWRRISSPSGISRVMIATAASRSITVARSRGLPSTLTAIAALASPGPIAAAISAPVTGPANSQAAAVGQRDHDRRRSADWSVKNVVRIHC